ncbi:MAG: transcription termination/antitermination protein NusA, partial [Hyphomicrobiaceae bacterium]|nr:transcription termination/antitermination protein NusA [Hyphomicrobiaceae bacterium]
DAIRSAIETASKKSFHNYGNIEIDFDEEQWNIRVYQIKEVVEKIEDHKTEISLKEAQAIDEDAEEGDIIRTEIAPGSFGRIAAQTAKQVIIQKIKEAEQKNIFAEFKKREGDIISGAIKKQARGAVIVDLGRTEGIVPPKEQSARDMYRFGERMKFYVLEVTEGERGSQIVLSRAIPDLVRLLFMMEVPEIYDGTVLIKGAVREGGDRAKVAVHSLEQDVDPVGACVGMRGARVQNVVSELQGEKVDIIQWNEDAASFIVNALAPAEVTKVVLDEDSNRIEVVVPESQLSLAIGRRGQNVRLASQLTGWDIDIVTEQEESERRQKEFAERSQILMETLDVDEVIAQLLVTEGFASVEEVAYVDVSEIAHIEGFDEDTGNEIQTRAREYLEKQESDRDAKRRELGVADDLAKIQGVTTSMMVVFGENEIKTVEDVAGCATDDLIGWTERKREKDAEVIRHKGILDSFEIGRSEAEEMIMSARVLAGWIKPEDLEPEPEPEAEGAEGEAAEGEAEEESVTAEAPQAEEGESSAREVEGGKSSAAEG